jgi:hypothetical protein
MSTIRRNGPAVWIYRCRENGPAGKVSRRGVLVLPDDAELFADGADSTRVALRVKDEFDAVRPFANDAIRFELEGRQRSSAITRFLWLGELAQSGFVPTEGRAKSFLKWCILTSERNTPKLK